METRELSRSICNAVLDKVNALYPQFMKRVNNIDIDYFEKIARDTEKLPEELNFELRDRVLADVKAYAMELLETSDIRGVIADMTKDIDLDTKKEVLDQAKEQLREYMDLSCGFNGGSQLSEEDLQKMYLDAKKQDLWERITRTNKYDVIEFHHALM